MTAHSKQSRPLYRWFADHTQLVDALIAAAIGLFFTGPYLLIAIESAVFGMDGLGYALYAIVVSLVLVTVFAFRRTRPVLTGTVSAVVCTIQLIVGEIPVVATTLLFPVVYALAAYAPRRASLAGIAYACLGLALAVLRYTGESILSGGFGIWIAAILLTLAILLCWSVTGLFWLIGDVTANRRRQQDELIEHNRRLEIQQAQERRLAAADERARIAREMHDIVAHSLSVIITQADGARYAAATKPDAATNALDTIAATGRESLGQMRRLLGVLRNDEASAMRPLPTLNDLHELVEEAQLSGAQVELRQNERSIQAQLPQGAELVIYRVVQESLTNVRKHAGPHPKVKIVLQWATERVYVSVTDDGRGAASDSAMADNDTLGHDLPGQGIRGMQERVSLYGGTLRAQPQHGGGFAVTAQIPYER